jgi:hypothetical protein
MAEEKKTIDPALAGFYEAMEKPTWRKSPMRFWLEYLKIPVIVRVLTWKVGMKMPKIGHGDKADEVVIFRSFMKAGLRFPLDRMLVEVLKTFEIYLHQLTPKAIIKVRIFIWVMRSQGLEPDAKCFCNIHELSYQTKQLGKSNTTTILVATASYPAMRPVILCQHFEKSG